MQDPRQQYLFNYMEYDDYESNDWDDLLNGYDNIELEADTDSLEEIVKDESEITIYNDYIDALIAYDLSQPKYPE